MTRIQLVHSIRLDDCEQYQDEVTVASPLSVVALAHAFLVVDEANFAVLTIPLSNVRAVHHGAS